MSGNMRIQAFAESDIGRVREVNEDAFLMDRELGVYAVCDGMGGHSAGEVASKETARIVRETLRTDRRDIEQELQKPGGHFRVVQIVADAVRSTCREVHAMACQAPDCAGMGTTLTMLQILGDRAVLAHVGDSRLYLLRDNRIHLLTSDHTLAHELIQKGQIERDSEAAERFGSVLTRSIGGQESVDVETLLFDILPGDRFLLCTDGVSRYIMDNSELTALLSDVSVDDLPARLLELANKRGGRDNSTCIVLEAQADQAPNAERAQRVLTALGQTSLFAGLSISRLMRIANVCRIRNHAAGEKLVTTGQLRDGMFVVLYGTAELQPGDGPGVEVTSGQSFGETGLAAEGHFRFDAHAKTALSVLFVPRDEFRKLVRRVPRLGRILLTRLLKEITHDLDAMVSGGDTTT